MIDDLLGSEHAVLATESSDAVGWHIIATFMDGIRADSSHDLHALFSSRARALLDTYALEATASRTAYPGNFHWVRVTAIAPSFGYLVHKLYASENQVVAAAVSLALDICSTEPLEERGVLEDVVGGRWTSHLPQVPRGSGQEMSIAALAEHQRPADVQPAPHFAVEDGRHRLLAFRALGLPVVRVRLG